MTTREECIRKYIEYKDINGMIPKREDFIKFAGIHKRELTTLFGRDCYSKLQQECGDDPNKLVLEKTPLEKVMRQYGDLALELGMLPNTSDWTYRRLRPSVEGLAKKPHYLKWCDFPRKFADWVESKNIAEYDKVLDEITKSFAKSNSRLQETDRDFDRLVHDIRLWSPARRRNSEGEYKIELRSHLKSLGYEVNEEYGQSNFDLLISTTYAVEIKKDPKISDYDRMFGQLARHLQHQRRVVALVFDAPGEDNFSKFSSLVDCYLNKDKTTIDIIKK